MSRALGRFATADAAPGHIAIDGKTLRGSRRLDARAIHVLAAFSTDLGAVVGDLVVEPDQNEITAAMALLKGLPLDGAVITGDAIFTRTARSVAPSGMAVAIICSSSRTTSRS